ncbi:MAG TPA: serine/threonine-protein kinase [Ktedonobacteraceae bacterium]|nr:serine/threonine-protein kinase [Ktedonobacteraceae bacterium]
MSYCCVGHHLNNDDTLYCAVCGSLIEGMMVGDYRLLAYVGKGSAADVYLAEQPALHKRKVVIKILHRSWSEARVSNFQREAAALALLSHPYIVPIFAYGVLSKQGEHIQKRGGEEARPYLVLPYAEQGSLAEIIARRGKRPWSLTRVVTIVKEMAEALDYAHARGILHRDVKPANILQMGSHAVLSDFGVSALIDADISHLSSPWAGSPGYMAPEVWQLRPGRYSDQYALAVTCYYLLAAQLPWQRDSNTHSPSWTELHCFVPPRSILELRPNLPLAVDVVLKRALAKDPHDRYPTVQAFADDLYVASQDITQAVSSFSGKLRSRKIVAQSAQTGIPARVEEKHKDKDQQPVRLSAEGRLASQPAPMRPNAQHKVVIAPAPDVARRWHISDISTDMIKACGRSDNWVWCALALNLLICLIVAGEYAWQLGNISVAANTLLTVWPCLLIGPLLALLFRRVTNRKVAWGLFWGVFFGLTDALVSILLCFLWAALIQLPVNFHCKPWCAAGDGFKVMYQTIFGLASQAIVPVVLSLWIAVLGGAIIGVMHVRHS